VMLGLVRLASPSYLTRQPRATQRVSKSGWIPGRTAFASTIWPAGGDRARDFVPGLGRSALVTGSDLVLDAGFRA